MRQVREFAVNLDRGDFDRCDKEYRSLNVPDKTPVTYGDLRDALAVLIDCLMEDLNDIADKLPE